MTKLYIGEKLIIDPDQFQPVGNYLTEKDIIGFATKEEIEEKFGTIFCICSSSEYETLESKNENTLYIVDDDEENTPTINEEDSNVDDSNDEIEEDNNTTES